MAGCLLQIRLSEGMYPVFLEDWFRVFPREQILIIRFEDYIKDVQGHLQQVFDHLELGTTFVHVFRCVSWSFTSTPPSPTKKVQNS